MIGGKKVKLSYCPIAAPAPIAVACASEDPKPEPPSPSFGVVVDRFVPGRAAWEAWEEEFFFLGGLLVYSLALG